MLEFFAGVVVGGCLGPALQAHLDDGTTTLSWCWRITRADGVTFGFTDHDRTLSFDGPSSSRKAG
jgi:hypothetical protein